MLIKGLFLQLLLEKKFKWRRNNNSIRKHILFNEKRELSDASLLSLDLFEIVIFEHQTANQVMEKIHGAAYVTIWDWELRYVKIFVILAFFFTDIIEF